MNNSKPQSDYEIISQQKKDGVVKPRNCQGCKFYEEEHGARYCGSGFATADSKSEIKEHRNSQKFCLSFIPQSNS